MKDEDKGNYTKNRPLKLAGWSFFENIDKPGHAHAYAQADGANRWIEIKRITDAVGNEADGYPQQVGAEKPRRAEQTGLISLDSSIKHIGERRDN